MHKNDKLIELENKISQAQQDYHLGQSLVDDLIYDAWVEELRGLDPENVLLSRVGADIPDDSAFDKVALPIKMGSLNKINYPSEMTTWFNNVAKKNEVLVLDKLDGLSVLVSYKDGKFVSATSRGNGEIGTDLSRNVIKMKGVPETLPTKFTGHFRGEILIELDTFKERFSEYKNPRNAASGITSRLDGKDCEHLSVYFYQVYGDDSFETEEDQLEFINFLGLNFPCYSVCETDKEVNDLWQQYQDKLRDELNYCIDGLVIRINDINFQATVDDGSLKPRYATAFKFANVSKPTFVKDVIWQVGRSGRITPVATFVPLELLGSTVERASIHNVSYIKRMGINIGAEVLVCKNNEIIPQIEKVVKAGDKEIDIPTHCPDCQTALEMEGEYLVCPNVAFCPSQKSGRLRNWITAQNILSWGVVVLDNLVESGLVNDVADLYSLTVDDLKSLDRMGDKSAQKLHDILHSSMETKLERFIDGLTIPGIGATVVGSVMDAGYDTLDKLMAAQLHHLESVSGVGVVKGNALYNGLKKNKDLIERLLKAGIVIKPRTQGKFKGMQFCFTGEMQHGRDELAQLVVDNGGVVKGSAVKTLSFLVWSDNSTTKYKSAAKNPNCKLISEEEFLELVE